MGRLTRALEAIPSIGVSIWRLASPGQAKAAITYQMTAAGHGALMALEAKSESASGSGRHQQRVPKGPKDTKEPKEPKETQEKADFIYL